MVYEFLPFMILPLYTSLEKIDPSQLEAAADLGARPVKAFPAVTLPLSVPGMIAGSILVFIPAMGMFVGAGLDGRRKNDAGGQPDPQPISELPVIGRSELRPPWCCSCSHWLLHWSTRAAPVLARRSWCEPKKTFFRAAPGRYSHIHLSLFTDHHFDHFLFQQSEAEC